MINCDFDSMLTVFEGCDKTLHALYQHHAIILLEYGLSRSQFNFHFKLPLIRLYLNCGVFKRAHDLFDELAIKHIQFDTLGHFLVDMGTSLGHLRGCRSVLDAASAIYHSNLRETPEATCQAFRYSTFSKVLFVSMNLIKTPSCRFQSL